MAKINATYSSGYYISPDTDFRKLEEQQAKEKRNQLKRGRDGGDDDPEVIKANTKRQTFAIPFDLYCDHCERRVPRGAHVYTNRRPTRMKYLNAIRIWELEIRCQYCSGLYYLQTDPETPKETGGYKCVKGCHRAEGDFLALNAKNEAAKAQWEKEQAEAEANPLAALERENEASRVLAERNRRVEEDVLARGEADDDTVLLAAMRRRRQVQQQQQQQQQASKGDGSTAPSSVFSSSKYTFDGGADDDEDADRTGSAPGLNLTEEELAAEEAAYERFESEMTARWQEAQATAARMSAMARAGQRGVGKGGDVSVGQSWFSDTALSSGTAGGATEGAASTDERCADGADDVLARALARYGKAIGGSSDEDSDVEAEMEEGDPQAQGSGDAKKRVGSVLALSSAPPTISSSSSHTSTRNAFVPSNSSSESDADDGEDPTPSVQASRPPPPSSNKGKKPSLLSSMFADDDDD